MKKVVTIGGGGGHAQVLKGIKDLPGLKITSICPSTDSGGSTGELNLDYSGPGYIGDLTKCIASLCDDQELSDTLMYRYKGGILDGHSLKNILFLSLERILGHEKALEKIYKLCGLGRHQVIPVTTQETELCAKLQIGNEILGEANIDKIAKNPLWNPDVHSILEVYLKPKVKASPKAITAIKNAEIIIISPGDLYSSIIPVLLPEGMRDAIKETRARIVLFLNIMSKKGETDNYSADDFVEKIERQLGRDTDYIICNNTPIPQEILTKYSLENKVNMGRLINPSNSRTIFVPLAEISEENQILSNPAIIKRVIKDILAKS
ncbi:MAG: hypothetical protein A2114_01240 [Candidatus Vogelbacteria bacterium GWA1_51_14]|uniref:Gluconeogenesis factor n=1 Tax=Candidatus Vogelbacteria bacterium GWA1_51_14 TaxID=1802435 RepID=A0A1G2Q971_9BACT|nr:MAG: hypothetical protein A2114_01240 [Candidatus Vogelbacteria bacterium GWA1_51_14]